MDYDITTERSWFYIYDWMGYCFIALMTIILILSLFVIIRAQRLKCKKQKYYHLRKMNIQLIVMFIISSSMWLTEEIRFHLATISVKAWAKHGIYFIEMFCNYMLYSLGVVFVLMFFHTIIFWKENINSEKE